MIYIAATTLTLFIIMAAACFISDCDIVKTEQAKTMKKLKNWLKQRRYKKALENSRQECSRKAYEIRGINCQHEWVDIEDRFEQCAECALVHYKPVYTNTTNRD